MKRKELEYPPKNPDLFRGEIVNWKFRENLTFGHKRYSIRFQITFADGTSVNKECGGFRTKQEALERKNELITLLSNHQYVPYHITVKQLFDHWLYYHMIDEQKIAYGTYKSYWNIIYNYIVPQIGNKKLDTVDRGTLLTVLDSFPSASLLNMAYSVLGSSFRYAKKANLVYKNHAEIAIRTKRKLHQKELADKAAINGPLPGNTTPNRRYALEAQDVCRLLYLTKIQFPDFYLALLLACTTGCRISELIALRFCDVDYSKKQLTINGQIGRPIDISDIPKEDSVYQRIAPKTNAGTRIIPISDFVLDEIAVARERYLKKFGKHYDDHGQGYLCPNQSGGANNRAIYKKYFASLKEQMNMPKDFHWHDLRHTYATIMEGNRVNLKELSEVMGHHSSDFTMKTYVEKKQPVFDGIKEYLDILKYAAEESLIEETKASSAKQHIIEFPGSLQLFNQIFEQAKTQADRAKQKSLATCREIPYNHSG